MVWFQQPSGFVFENGFGKNGGIVEMMFSKVLGILVKTGIRCCRLRWTGSPVAVLEKGWENSSKEPYGQKCDFEKCFIKINPA